jgi:hypothetical protein
MSAHNMSNRNSEYCILNLNYQKRMDHSYIEHSLFKNMYAFLY